MSSQGLANRSKLGWKKGGGEDKKDLRAISVHSGICSWPPGFRGATDPWQIRVVNVETSPTLQLGGLQAAKAGPKIPFGSIQDFQQFGWHCLCLSATSCSFQCSLTIVFLRVHCTSDHLTSSSSALFNPSVYLMLKKLTKIKLVFAEEPCSFCFCIRYRSSL